MSKFKLVHWKFKDILIWKISHVLSILSLIEQEYFWGSSGL